jgi:hypothetical protein
MRISYTPLIPGESPWLAEPKLAERRLVGGDGFEPPTLSV